MAQSHLVTYTVSARDSETLAKLSEELATARGIDTIAPFGATLHVAGRDEAELEAAIAPFRERPGLTWIRSPPSLEDVFIGLMSRAKDNFQ